MEKNVIDFIENLGDKLCEIERYALIDEIKMFSTEGYGYHDKAIESPIEQILFSALFYLIKINNLRFADPDEIGNYCILYGINITPQFIFNKYKVDFKVEYSKCIWSRDLKKTVADETKTILVECDSQEWHERTESERRYEKKRDRAILKSGLKIFHYTGREIINTPLAIAAEILTEVVGYNISED